MNLPAFSKVPRAGFTLLELLVVVVIILTIAGLLLAYGWGAIMKTVRVTATKQRMDAIKFGLEVHRGEERVASLQARLLGRQVEMRPLRAVLQVMTEQHGLDLKTAIGGIQMPPNIRSRYQWQPDSTLWREINTSLDYVICFRDRQAAMRDRATGWGKEGDVRDIYDDLLTDGQCKTHPRFQDMVARLGYNNGMANIQCYDLQYVWNDGVASRPSSAFKWDETNGAGTWLTRSGNTSPIGESLSATLEVVPDRPVTTDWFYQQWPYLYETAVQGSDGKPIFTQRTYPPTDWETADATVAKPPLWPWPWGKPIITRLYGTPAAGYIDRHDLGQLSPYQALEILVAAGAISDDIDGRDAYRQDRSVGRPWNDRWGNPLVPVFACQLAPRYDFYRKPDPQDVYDYDATTKKPVFSRMLHGGRDYLYRKCRDEYQRGRTIYIAVAAAGPELQVPLPVTWSTGDDPTVCKSIWMQVKEICQIGRNADGTDQENAWTEASWSAAPWEGKSILDVEREITGIEYMSFISTPLDMY